MTLIQTSLARASYCGAPSSAAKLCVSGILLVAVVGCSAVFESSEPVTTSSVACNTDAGAYFLPKKHLILRVTQEAANKPFVLTHDTASVPDRDHFYCLDYLGSSASEDTIEVVRNANGLLQQVSSTTVDKSREIALKVLDIGLVAITGNPDATLGGRSFGLFQDKQLLAEFNFDPLDWRRLSEINATLGHYGYCVFIDVHARLTQTLDARAYCDNPRKYETAVVPLAPLAPELVVAARAESKRSILYRASFTHHMVVLRRDGRKAPWVLHQSVLLELPNLSPIFSVAVDRAFFVTKFTKLEFKDGVLQDVTIDKPSEVLALSELPLRVVHAVVAIPGEVIKVRISATNNRKRIVEAQTQLIKTRQEHRELLAALNKRNADSQLNNIRRLENEVAPPPAANRLHSQCMTHCGTRLQHIQPPQQCIEPCEAKCAGAKSDQALGQCISEFKG